MANDTLDPSPGALAQGEGEHSQSFTANAGAINTCSVKKTTADVQACMA
jgi:hypothetical protein